MANIIITGANEGIGYYMIKKLLADGNRVSVLDIETQNLEILKISTIAILFFIRLT